MVSPLPAPSRSSGDRVVPYLDEEVLEVSRSGEVCLTCLFFRHHASSNCRLQLIFLPHQELIAQVVHLTNRRRN